MYFQDSWHHAFSTKLVNLRKRGKLRGPETEKMKKKYAKQAASGARNQPTITSTKKLSSHQPVSVDEEYMRKKKK